MDELKYGTRNKRGDYLPNRYLSYSPFFLSPVKARAILSWTKGYLIGWNTLFFASALLWYFFVLPHREVMATLQWGWTLKLFAVNWGAIFLFYGFFELRYYRMQVQERRFKYNSKFPAEQPSDVFWFRSQNWDNALRSMFLSVPLGTLVEVFALWMMASGKVPVVEFSDNPLWITLLVLVTPLIHETHFFAIHRIIHIEPLYRWIHKLHHNSVNPSPWSSLSMHPVEGTAYFAEILWHLVLFSNPFLLVLQWNTAAFAAAVGHLGFDKLEITEDSAFASHSYGHYLHHKYFEVNYCDDGILPLDRWFGCFHDGSPEAEERMKERFRARKAKLAQKAARKAAKGTPAE